MLNGTRNPIAVTLAVLAALLSGVVLRWTDSTLLSVCVLVCGLILAASPRILNEWDRGVLLRLGKFNRILPPGIAWIIPGIDSITELVDRNGTAMQLRAMNMTYESIKERGALMVIPSGMMDSLNANVMGMAAAGFRADGAGQGTP